MPKPIVQTDPKLYLEVPAYNVGRLIIYQAKQALQEKSSEVAVSETDLNQALDQ